MLMQSQIDRIQHEWMLSYVAAPCLHVGCGEKYVSGCVNIDPNPDRPVVDHRWDVHDLPVPDNTYASVVSSHVIPALRFPTVAFREMTRVLCIGGLMAHVIPDNACAPQRHNKHHPWDFQHHNWFSPAQFRAEILAPMERAGWIEVLECQTFPEFLPEQPFSFRVVARKVGHVPQRRTV